MNADLLMIAQFNSLHLSDFHYAEGSSIDTVHFCVILLPKNFRPFHHFVDAAI
jgi:hypothetical protein